MNKRNKNSYFEFENERKTTPFGKLPDESNATHFIIPGN